MATRRRRKKIDVYVIGKDENSRDGYAILDIIERVPREGTFLTVMYRGERHIVVGGKGAERIFVDYGRDQISRN